MTKEVNIIDIDRIDDAIDLSCGLMKEGFVNQGCGISKYKPGKNDLGFPYHHPIVCIRWKQKDGWWGFAVFEKLPKMQGEKNREYKT